VPLLTVSQPRFDQWEINLAAIYWPRTKQAVRFSIRNKLACNNASTNEFRVPVASHLNP
jgi:hypothetical protein